MLKDERMENLKGTQWEENIAIIVENLKGKMKEGNDSWSMFPWNSNRYCKNKMIVTIKEKLSVFYCVSLPIWGMDTDKKPLKNEFIALSAYY